MKEEILERAAPSRRGPYPDLKALRESKGKTLKDISQRTRIRVAYLEAIEDGQFRFLPERTYAESFIRAYAHELGIDSSLILSHYRTYEQDLAGAGEEKESGTAALPALRTPVDFSRWLGAGAATFQWIKGHVRILSRSLAVLFVAFAVFYFLYTSENPESDVARAPSGTATEMKSPAETQQAGPATSLQEPGKEAAAVSPDQSGVPPQPEAKNEVQPPSTPLTLVITAKETTWVRIVEDEDTPHQYLLRPGDRVERHAQDVFHLDVGNAGGIDVQFQGNQLGSIGKSGEVVHLVLPEQAGR
jgi:cytoskeleton protein RodZ